MKAFEEEWKHTLLEDKYKFIAETYWRTALEWAKREAIAQDERGDISRVVISRELGGD